MSECKRLALLVARGFRGHKWLYVRIALALSALVLMLCLFSAYSVAFYRAQDEIRGENVSANYLIADRKLSYGSSEPVRVVRRELKALRDLPFFPVYPHLSLELGGTRYGYKDGGTLFYRPVAVYEGDPFLPGDGRELALRFGVSSPLEGRLPERMGEIAVSALFLKAYGAEAALGSELVLYADGREVLRSTLCGVVREEYDALCGTNSAPADFPAPVLILDGSEPCLDERGEEIFLYPLRDWLTREEADAAEAEGFVYAGYNILLRIEAVNNMQTVARRLLVIVGASVGFGLVLLILLMMEKYVKSFARSGGILLACGMTERELYRFLLAGLFALGAAAFALAVPLTFGAFYGIGFLLGQVYAVTFRISLLSVIALLAAGLVAVFCLCLLFFGYAALCMRSKSVKELFDLRTE